MGMQYFKPLIAATAAFVVSAAPALATPRLHQQAVADARANRFDAALPVLQRLAREHPGKLAYQYDWIVVLSWAERHGEALAASRTLRLNARTPEYVLLAIGKSALHGGDAERAIQAYRLATKRRPNNADAKLGLSRALQAQSEATMRTAVPAPMPAGAPTLASVTAAATETPPAPASNLAADQERNAAHIRAAGEQLDTDFTKGRYRLIDAALAENAALADAARNAGAQDVLRRLAHDRVVALRLRGHMAHAVAAFRALDASGDAVPAYVVNAAADASLALREPEQARALYQRALASDASNAGTKTGLMYAQLEAENFPGVEHAVGELLASTNRSLAARRTQAMMLRFADRLAEAEALLDALTREFPGHTGIRLDQADLLARRGLPRAAARLYAQVLDSEPAHLNARIGLANALWAQGDIAQAADAVTSLRRDAPEHPGVQRLLRDWQRRQRPMLSSGVTTGFGQGHVAGNDDLTWESTLYSGQTQRGLRWYGTHHKAQASFGGNSARHARVGAGMEWTRRDLQTSVELGQDLHNARDTVWAAGAGWQFNDAASLRARYESQTNDFPLKGRVPDAQAGAPTHLHASKMLVGGAYRWNESRRAAADLSYYDFNDGNRRQALAMSFSERLYSANGHTLDLQPAFYASSNTLRDAFYFNPKRDLALSATLTADWLAWRRYERSFNQRVAATLGTYRQISDVRRNDAWVEQNYGFKPFWDLRYEHEWQWGPDRSARYGLGGRRFAYDGVYETKHYVYLHLNWRF